jgi:hypothetical protein
MHTDISYKNSPAPKFDAVEDIKKWLGAKKWKEVSPQMAKIKDPQQFCFLAGIAGIQWFPVEAWYDLYHGEGSYKAAWERVELMEEAEKAASL